jgi:serine/threonine protein kinase
VVKIGGFGYSKSAYMDSMAKTMVGMRGYMAPEVFMSSGAYDAAKTDVWAVGVILYQMLTGRLPFCHDSAASGVLDRAMMQRIMRGQYVLAMLVASFVGLLISITVSSCTRTWSGVLPCENARR